ncbi:MAG: hypothetical protein NTU98_00120 [Bacteroidetes bacterium]|nr:hypothetical protein [Bacteroidota bacterium]
MKSMIDTLGELVSFLSKDRISVSDVVTQIGINLDDPGVPLPITIKTKIPGIQTVKLARYPDSGLPYVLSIRFEKHAGPTLWNLKSCFGEYRQILTGPEQLPAFIFYPETNQKLWSVGVIAGVEPGSDVEVSFVSTIDLRRDPVL